MVRVAWQMATASASQASSDAIVSSSATGGGFACEALGSPIAVHPPTIHHVHRVWDRAIDKGRLYGLRLDGTWMHVGTPEAVIDAERLMTRADAS